MERVMGRQVNEKNLSTREARKLLPIRNEPYWRNEGEGQHIGYYRGKRVAKWVARYRIPGSSGGYHKITLGMADDRPGIEADGNKLFDWKQAKLAALNWFRQMDEADGIKFGPYTVSAALDDYMKSFTGKDRVNTQRRIDVLIKPSLGNYQASKLTTALIKSWHNTRAATPARLRTSAGSAMLKARPLITEEDKRKRRSTANRDLTVLKAALNVAYQNGRIATDDAWRRVKPFPNVERPKLRYLNDDEVRRLVEACEPPFRQIVQATLLTGARYQELARARVRDFDTIAGTLWIPDAKANRPRVCYLGHEGKALFTAMSNTKSSDDLLLPRDDGAQWNNSQQIRRIGLACHHAGINPPATFHDLRRTYGARLALNGVPMAVIAEALGQADERITRRHYAHLSPNYVAEQVRKHSAGMGIVPMEENITQISKIRKSA